MSGEIFISYRREDASGWARSVSDRLSQHFGADEIFMDVDTLEAGVDFEERIEKSLAGCVVLIAVIGKRWYKARWFEPKTRKDYVRFEVAYALKHGISVIPVLVDGAKMPSPNGLPNDLKPLVRRHALEITNTSFGGVCQRLADAIQRERAAKEDPWVNSLGMKFVPVADTQVLFSIWDTRVQDFETFVRSTGYDATGGMYSIGKDGPKQRGATWKEPGFSQGPTHPVVGVSWNDAKEFCKWLTKREQSTGDLPQDREYRLPKDEEWSAAVGLKNEIGNTPKEKDGKIKLYPWDIPQKRDKSWPPPSGAGNYCRRGVEAWKPNQKTGQSLKAITTGIHELVQWEAFQPTSYGLYDMGGNVWQWCEDWFHAGRETTVCCAVRRGRPGRSPRSARFVSHVVTPGLRHDVFGFRCVVAAESSR